MKPIYFVSLFLLLFSSCTIEKRYIASTNYQHEWKDFNQPKQTEKTLDIAITPELRYESTGNNNFKNVNSEQLGGYLGASTVLKNNVLINLGSGYTTGKAGYNVDSLNVVSYNSHNLQGNLQFSYLIKKDEEKEVYPLIFGVNYSIDSGNYLEFRKQSLREVTQDPFLDPLKKVDAKNNLLSYQVGTKFVRRVDDNSVSGYLGALVLDKSTAKALDSGTISLNSSLAGTYSNFLFKLRLSSGRYGGVGFGAGYTFQ